MYAQDNNSLPVWIILSQAQHHISINSQPFLVGIVSILLILRSDGSDDDNDDEEDEEEAEDPSLSNISKWDLNFGEPAHSHGTTRIGQNFPTSPQSQNTKLTHCSIYVLI